MDATQDATIVHVSFFDLCYGDEVLLPRFLRSINDLQELHVMGDDVNYCLPRPISALFKMICDGAFKKLKVLDLSSMRVSDENNWGLLVEAMTNGSLQHLEELNFYGHGYALQHVRGAVEALANGACPHLRRLNMWGTTWSADGYEDPLLKAINSGHLSNLEVLDISNCGLNENVLASIKGALPCTVSVRE